MEQGFGGGGLFETFTYIMAVSLGYFVHLSTGKRIRRK
jgi:hypothetical protein